MSLFWNYVISSICHGLECLLQIAPIFLTLGFMMLLQRVRSLEDELERLRSAAAGDNRAGRSAAAVAMTQVRASVHCRMDRDLFK